MDVSVTDHLATAPPHRDAQRGSALVLMLVLTASVAAALSAALGGIDPGRRADRMARRTAQRLAAATEALYGHFNTHGSFPVTLSGVVGRGRMDAGSLEDPYRGAGQLGYRILRVNPDVVAVYSVGANGRDDGGAGDDLTRTVSSSVAGRAATSDRWGVTRRVLASRARAHSIGTPLQDAGAASQVRDMLVTVEDLPTEDWETRFDLPLRSLRDGWGTGFRYETTPSVGLRSAGPDRVFDTGDDLAFVW
ncbi:MAG: hypothetical protein AAF628_02435 [Planctomycetota bacterium]